MLSDRCPVCLSVCDVGVLCSVLDADSGEYKEACEWGARWCVLANCGLATIDMGRKLGVVPLFGEGGVGSPSGTMQPGTRPTFIRSGILIHPAIWPQQIWAENWGLYPFGKGELSPHLTQCGQGRGLSARLVSSSSVKPFGHNTPTLQTYRQTEQTGQTDNGPIAYGEPFYKRSPKNQPYIQLRYVFKHQRK